MNDTVTATGTARVGGQVPYTEEELAEGNLPEYPFKFVPTETFQAEVAGYVNTYCAGLGYCARNPNTHADLRAKAETWLEEGKIQRVR